MYTFIANGTLINIDIISSKFLRERIKIKIISVIDQKNLKKIKHGRKAGQIQMYPLMKAKTKVIQFLHYYSIWK